MQILDRKNIIFFLTKALCSISIFFVVFFFSKSYKVKEKKETSCESWLS